MDIIHRYLFSHSLIHSLRHNSHLHWQSLRNLLSVVVSTIVVFRIVSVPRLLIYALNSNPPIACIRKWSTYNGVSVPLKDNLQFLQPSAMYQPSRKMTISEVRHKFSQVIDLTDTVFWNGEKEMFIDKPQFWHFFKKAIIIPEDSQ